jgi:hypothetical protein
VRQAIVVLAAVLLLAGCGKQSYSSKLSAMCEDFAKREQQIGEPHSPSDVAARGDRIVKAYDEAILQPLLRTTPPGDVAPDVARLRRIARQQRSTLRALADAGKQGDIQKLRRLAVRNAQLNQQAGDIARRLNADSCT